MAAEGLIILLYNFLCQFISIYLIVSDESVYQLPSTWEAFIELTLYSSTMCISLTKPNIKKYYFVMQCDINDQLQNGVEENNNKVPGTTIDKVR